LSGDERWANWASSMAFSAATTCSQSTSSFMVDSPKSGDQVCSFALSASACLATRGLRVADRDATARIGDAGRPSVGMLHGRDRGVGRAVARRAAPTPPRTGRSRMSKRYAVATEC
jgi:hypothetical protein